MFAEVLRGIESVTDAHNYQTMLAHYGYLPEREEERLTSLLSYNIDGLILSERHHTPRTLKMIEVAGIPVVELMDCVSPCIDLAVGFNNFEAARQMTQQIIAHGHRHVVYFGARQDERTIIKQQGMSRRCVNPARAVQHHDRAVFLLFRRRRAAAPGAARLSADRQYLLHQR